MPPQRPIASRARLARQQETRVIDEVVAAATELARHRMGALICFEQEANLDEFVVAQGTTLDSSVQRELLVSLFIPDSLNKLHDGAVVIRNLRIAKGGVFFPMPDTKVLDKSMGSRHRAALGITEETDAVVVVVSEERGTISFCFNGNIVPNLDGASLKQALLGLFGQRARGKKKAEAPRTGKRPSMNTGSMRVPTGGFAIRASQVPPVPGMSPMATTGSQPVIAVASVAPAVPAPSLPVSPPPAADSSRPVVLVDEESVPMRMTLNPESEHPMPPASLTAIETPIPMPSSEPPADKD